MSTGICIVGTAYDQIGRKLALGYEFLGEQTLKNIAKPIRVYRVLMEPELAGLVIDKDKRKPGVSRRNVLLPALVLAGIAVAAWRIVSGPAPPSSGTALEEMTEITSPAKPSIAVLPFNNLSGDPEQEYFSDGITNDIITELSKFREPPVIASNSVFVYKGKPVNAQEVNRELGARYILEGSVQRVDQKVRVNAQLVDATTGLHLWAERYDRDLEDLFAVQDEILRTIVTTLAVKIDAEERARVMRKDTSSLKAYDYVLRGREYLSRVTRSETMQARQLFKKAIEIDPRYAAAYVGLGRSHNLFLFSSGNGYGVAIDNPNGKKTYMKMNFAGFGPGIGVKDFRAVLIFKNKLKLRFPVIQGIGQKLPRSAAAKRRDEFRLIRRIHLFLPLVE